MPLSREEALTKFTVKQLIGFLKEPVNADVKNFLLEFLKAIYTERNVAASVSDEEIALDAMARLIVGDEKCAAIAVSGDKVLIGSNKHIHANASLTVTKTFCILEKNLILRQYHLEFEDTLIYSTPGKPDKTIGTKKSGPVVYQFDDTIGGYKIISGDPTIVFTQDEHGIKFCEAPVPLGLNVVLKEDLEVLKAAPMFVQIPLCTQPSEIDPLAQRTSLLLTTLAYLAHTALSRDRDLRSRAFLLNEAKHERWSVFLQNSLTYELSTSREYQAHLMPFSEGRIQMGKLYDELVADYCRFNKEHEQRTSLKSFEEWFCGISDKIHAHAFAETPAFISDNPVPFLDKLAKYFRNLIIVENFVIHSARDRGPLISALENIKDLSRKLDLLVVISSPGEDDHAEIRLLLHHLKENPSLRNYFGITMLCCVLCAHTMKQFGANYRGTHATLFGNWPIAPFIQNPAAFKTFLGPKLYRIYLELQKKQCRPPNTPKGVTVPMSIAAEACLIEIAGLNTEKALKSLGFPPGLFMPGSSDPSQLFSDDDKPPRRAAELKAAPLEIRSAITPPLPELMASAAVPAAHISHGDSKEDSFKKRAGKPPRSSTPFGASHGETRDALPVAAPLYKS